MKKKILLLMAVLYGCFFTANAQINCQANIIGITGWRNYNRELLTIPPMLPPAR